MIRRGTESDLFAVEQIQSAAPSAAQWPVSDYLPLLFHVGEANGEVAGYLVARDLGSDEYELLNLAVHPAHRGLGWGQRLLSALPPGRTFLEVRASNAAAIHLYHKVGFHSVGRRRGYYQNPVEDGIVMELKR